eukprot:TRINITY_DN18431_c0_g1_i1.p2 TRINITY_DN18431_c0_g1~~TRINITY_DN18431_c0_g1_i1.p2  ORF type:complete len:228 (+),score=51.91 TRINITY_DN18431_c0_g1_i1:51-686(+)
MPAFDGWVAGRRRSQSDLRRSSATSPRPVASELSRSRRDYVALLEWAMERVPAEVGAPPEPLDRENIAAAIRVSGRNPPPAPAAEGSRAASASPQPRRRRDPRPAHRPAPEARCVPAPRLPPSPLPRKSLTPRPVVRRVEAEQAAVKPLRVNILDLLSRPSISDPVDQYRDVSASLRSKLYGSPHPVRHVLCHQEAMGMADARPRPPPVAP